MDERYIRKKGAHRMRRRDLSFLQNSAVKGTQTRLRVNWMFSFIPTWGWPSCKTSTNVPSEQTAALTAFSDGETRPEVSPSVPFRLGPVDFLFLHNGGSSHSALPPERWLLVPSQVTELWHKDGKKGNYFKMNIETKNPTYCYLVCECSFAKKLYVWGCGVKRVACLWFQPICELTLDSDTFHNEGHILDIFLSVVQ